MPIQYQRYITRNDIIANKDKIYIFGDNEKRCGFGGQARHMRGEPNSYGIATKKAPSMSREALWFNDDFERVKPIIDADFEPIIEASSCGVMVVCPHDGIGTGYARLPANAPRIFEYIVNKIRRIEYANN